MDRLEILKNFSAKGVIIPCTDGIIIDEDCSIGKGTVILPGTIVTGGSVIGEGCKIGPNSYIDKTTIGEGTEIKATFTAESTIGCGVKIGPFCNIRPNSRIKDGVKMGDFVEIKNSVIGEKTAVAHLTYVGDSDVGSHVNFGCGTVTVNYDGKNKFRTKIGDNVFIGCNTNLVAPVSVGNGAYIAAGSTIVDNIPDGAFAIARERQTTKENWVKKDKVK